MIEKITLKNVATFGDEPVVIDGLKKFNFFFGANGTGKTTISRAIADLTELPECNLSWKNNLDLDVRVYNRDFVDQNFDQRIKGVFTLGEQEVGVEAEIAAIRAEIGNIDSDITALSRTLQGDDGNGGKEGDLTALEDEYLERFFVQKRKHDKRLAGGLKGFMGTKESFRDNLLSESTSNTSNLFSVTDLEERAAKVYSDTLERGQAISPLSVERILALESESILAKQIIGKKDVDIAAMIHRLNNSDWVEQGLPYYETNDGICPFCQQSTNVSFTNSLREYFDETFNQDRMAIDALYTDYTAECSRIQQQVQEIIESHSEFVENDKLDAEKRILDSLVMVNMQRLAQKKKEASQSVALDSLRNVLDAIVQLIDSANEKVTIHNALINQLGDERKRLTREIWRFIVEESKEDVENYERKKSEFEAAITNLESQLQSKRTDKQEKETRLRELERQNVSIQPTIEGINNILSAFGFTSFELDKGEDGRSYKLVRSNGSDAQATLSEGERSFVTFLYFYHLLKGSHDESGMTADRVVVFDDPISSLDSDILFVVSSLIRELYGDLRIDAGSIRQLFILTHNVYFHKEVTYDRRRGSGKLNDETFWLVKKRGETSFVEPQDYNPVKSSYELLWDEVRTNAEQRNNLTIQNTLRRILENYFKLLGNIPLDNLYEQFDGDDKVKCKDLCSWVNDGSHSGGILSEEHYLPPDGATVEKYLQVFREIFEKNDQIAHYEMMMGSESSQEDNEAMEGVRVTA